jgi:hypothetical protein
MPSPPLTNREYAYFRVTGPGRHEDITAKLGYRPSDAWNADDLNPRTNKARGFMCWKLDSGLDDTHPLDRHIDQLLLLLGAKEAALRELWVDYDLQIVCTGHYPPSGHGLYLDREKVRQAAKAGVAFDLDFYFVDDHDDDV